MADELFPFSWPVYKGTYTWEKDVMVRLPSHEKPCPDPKRDCWLVVSGSSHELTEYAPLSSHTSLFRTFADTEPTQEGILGFANEYGLLTVGALVFPQRGFTRPFMGEPMRFWVEGIRDMRAALKVWDLVRKGDVEELARCVHWEEDKITVSVTTPCDPDSSVNYFADAERLIPDDVIKPAYLYVQGKITSAMSGRVSPRLHWSMERSRPVLRFVPHNLLGALWLQFAQAVHGNKQYRRCSECQTWFELTPDIARTNRLYCTNACRTKAYRRRKEAQRLHAKGIPVEEIAGA